MRGRADSILPMLAAAAVFLLLAGCASPPEVPLPPPTPKPSNQAEIIAAPSGGGIDIAITLPRSATVRFSSSEQQLMVTLNKATDLSGLRALPRRFPGCLRLVQTGADWALLRAHPGLEFRARQQYRQIIIRLRPSPSGAACAP